MVFVAVFASIGMLAQPAHALDNATWDGSQLTYDIHQFNADPTAPDISGYPNEYRWIDTSTSPNKATVIYTAGTPSASTKAELVTYDFSSSGDYTNSSAAQSLSITDTSATAGSASGNNVLNSTCDSSATGAFGWVLCPVSNWLAGGIDGVYKFISQFLEVEPITTSNNGIYQVWQKALTIANLCFIAVFLVIVYSHLTSMGYSNYNIKDMVPRLIIAAIAVNLSYWVCALGVDISNLLGHSIQAILVSVRESLNLNVNISWSGMTSYILSGGVAVAGLSFAAAAGGSFLSLGFILIGALISAGLAVLAAFIILAARQALIIIFIMVSPLAFVAMVLPGTKSLFDKWRKAFVTLLVFFPAFALLFGGSQLASAAIINSQNGGDGNILIALIGLIVQFVPLALTPVIVRLSSGIMGQIANMTNNRQKGIADRARNWANDNAEAHKKEKLARAAKRRDGLSDAKGFWGRTRKYSSRVRPSNLGLAMDQNKRKRDEAIKENDEYLGNRANADRMKKLDQAEDGSWYNSRPSSRRNARQRQRMIDSHDYHKQAETYKGEIDAEGEAHWRQRFDPKSHHYDYGIHQADLATRISKDKAATAEAQYEALISGIKATGENPYAKMSGVDARLKSANIGAMANTMATLAVEMDAAENAKTNADIKLKGRIAEAYKQSFDTDGELLKRAAGVGGELAETRVYARASKTVIDAAVEAVEVNKTLTSSMNRDQLKKLLYTGMIGEKAQTVEMQQAAMYALLDEKGNNQDAQEIRDAIAQKGFMVDAETGKYYEAKRDDNEFLIRGPDGRAQIDMSKEISAKEAGDRRDWQQFFDDAAGKSPHSMVTYSGTNKSEARSGNLVDDMRGAFIRDARDGKLSPDKILKADIDELKSLYYDMTDPRGQFYNLPPAEKARYGAAFESAILQLQKNPNVNSGIDDRNRGLMNDILAVVNPDYSIGTSPDGKPMYAVAEDNSILSPAERAASGSTKTFASPVGIWPDYYSNYKIKIPKVEKDD